MAVVQANIDHTDEAAMATVAADDEAAFTALTRRYRRELHVHCYRMLASFDDAEDLVQETFLRAWQKRKTYQGRAPFRAWLYRIATNACLDFLRRHERRVVELAAKTAESDAGPMVAHVEWLQPYPDRLLSSGDAEGGDPSAMVVRRETIELAFLVALQYLPPKQRVVLILRDVLDWSAKETAELLETTVASVNAALQRARVTVRRRAPKRERASSQGEPSEQDLQLAQQYADAVEQMDMEGLTRLLRDDLRFTMPPSPFAVVGSKAAVDSWVSGGLGSPPYDDFRCVVTWANGQPAVANYIKPPGETQYRPFALDVLQIEGGRIAEIVAFDMEGMAGAFGVPESLA